MKWKKLMRLKKKKRMMIHLGLMSYEHTEKQLTYKRD